MQPERSARAATPDDEDFLWLLYVSTRASEVEQFGWPPQQQEAFLRMQYRARRGSYRASFPQAEYRILLENGVPVGAMIVARGSQEIRLVDIAFLPEHRNRGYGGREIADLIRQAGILSVPFRLSVRLGNPALRLYTRLGLVSKRAGDMYIEMEYTPARERNVDPSSS
jgi:ribosomal protein S18 acetylase RimI-like enzyme